MTIRVLLVDDEPMFLEALRALLDHDDRVEVAGATSDGEAAIELADRVHPDVVLLDLAMPGMSGFELTRKLLAATPALRVIAVSGLSHESDASKALEAGATSFLMKGGLYSEVAEAIVGAAATQA